MARATIEEVRAVKATSLENDSVQAFINAATVTVDRVAACDPSLTAEELKQIEIFYSAHLISAQDPELMSEKVENFQNVFARGSNTGMGVMSTQYGQMANTLSRGCLAELDKPEAFYAIGGT